MNRSLPSDFPPLVRSFWQRRRFLSLFAVALIMSSLIGGSSVADGTTNLVDVVQIVSVVAFVGGMVTLAMAMVGDAFWP